MENIEYKVGIAFRRYGTSSNYTDYGVSWLLSTAIEILNKEDGY